MTLIAGPAASIARNAESRSGNVHGHGTSATSPGCSPASVARASSAPGAESANGPGVPGGGGAMSEPSAARYTAAGHRSGVAQVMMTTGAPGRATRRASSSARRGVAAYWNELKPTMASEASSSYGSVSRSPRTKSPLGTRSAAISSSSGVASTPLTMAPRSAASRAASPAPQPRSSSSVPCLTASRSSTAVYTGSIWASIPHHSRGRAPHSALCASAVPPATDEPDMTASWVDGGGWMLSSAGNSHIGVLPILTPLTAATRVSGAGIIEGHRGRAT